MNKVIKEIAIKKALIAKYGVAIDPQFGECDLEQIVLGDVPKRDKVRERYLQKTFDEKLKEV